VVAVSSSSQSWYLNRLNTTILHVYREHVSDLG
jgi:hypothetical protein